MQNPQMAWRGAAMAATRSELPHCGQRGGSRDHGRNGLYGPICGVIRDQRQGNVGSKVSASDAVRCSLSPLTAVKCSGFHQRPPPMVIAISNMNTQGFRSLHPRTLDCQESTEVCCTGPRLRLRTAYVDRGCGPAIGQETPIWGILGHMSNSVRIAPKCHIASAQIEF